VAVAIYAVSLAACLGMSALYHRPDWTPRRKRQMKKLDHSTIFLLIAGTYTPIAAIALPPVLAVLSLVAIWVAAALGVVMAVFWADPPMILEVGAYLTMGTVGLLLIPALLTTIGIVGVLLLAAGGGLYWCGAVVYARHRPDPWPATFGFHEVFHVFVVLAASTHFLAIALVTAR